MRSLLTASLMLLALAAVAPAPAAELDPACAADTRRFCPHDAPGSMRQAACMRHHQASLTPACKRGLAAQAEAAAAACRNDIDKFCPTVQPGGGRIGKCLMPHRNELAPRCKAAAGNL